MRLPTRPSLRARRALTSPAWHTWIRLMTSALGSQNQPRISEPGSAALSIHPLHPISHWGHCLSSSTWIESTSGAGPEQRENGRYTENPCMVRMSVGLERSGHMDGHKDRTGQSRTGRALAFSAVPRRPCLRHDSFSLFGFFPTIVYVRILNRLPAFLGLGQVRKVCRYFLSWLVFSPASF
jgi:hypothetical protein